MGVAAEDDEEQPGQASQDDDAVGEDQPVALRPELARDEAVTRQEEAQPRKVGEGGVGGQEQDEHGGRLDAVVDRARPEQVAAELRDHGLLRVRLDAEVVGEDR